MAKRKAKQPHKGWKGAARKRHERKKTIRDNPVVGGMTEAQAERILSEMRSGRSE